MFQDAGFSKALKDREREREKLEFQEDNIG